MRKDQIKNVSYLRDMRKELRKNLTPAEAALWKMLQNKQLKGKKFRRQVSIENYIVDFYCAEARLIIELDGEVHNHPAVAENDQHRDERLRDLCYTVLRFENKDVFNLPEWVMSQLEQCLV